MLWALFTVIAATGQTLRNALQHDLTARLGIAGATHVRFLFGLPFSFLFLAIMALIMREGVPAIPVAILPVVALAALTQIGATGFMLAAMKTKSFTVTIAYTKIEPVLVALFGLFFLGDALTAPMATAILVATSGVLLTAWPKGGGGWSFQALALGVIAAALFAISAVGFRAGIRALPEGSFAMRASTILVIGLAMQTLTLTTYLALTNRPALAAIFRAWRPSLFAGFMGAFASQFWFLGFSLASAAEVRTLALIEVPLARVISGRMFSERPTKREGLGLVLIVVGVGLLLNV